MRKGILSIIVLAATVIACAAPGAPENLAADESSSSSAMPSPSPSATQTQMVTETQEIPFTETTVNDATMLVGMTQIRTAGKNGVKTLTFEVTIVGGEVVDKKLISAEVTTEPVTQVVAVGTKQTAPAPPPPPAQQCHSSYTGACVPIASDVDCAGGSGNGPAYVSGPVYVVGPDVYDLDRDGDGVACE
jgi:hypothetical protein